MFRVYRRKNPRKVDIPYETYRELSKTLEFAVAQLFELLDDHTDNIELTEKAVLKDLLHKLNAVYFTMEGTKRVIRTRPETTSDRNP